MYTTQQLPLEAHTDHTLQQVVDDVSGPLYHQRHLQPPPPVNSTTCPPTIYQLAEFLSTMIHLLWHVRRSSVLALHSASRHCDFMATNLFGNQGEAASVLQGPDATFQKFCQQVLAATQLSESVVILSLKYIAKLLQTNPTIQGAQGSEYRLLVVALLLANKFHDDNTFTNKTWADISGMKLHELDIMELEFLGVLDYELFIRKHEFDNWKTGLLTLMKQLENATLMQAMDSTTMNNMGLSIPTPDPTWHSPTNNILTQQQQQYLYLLTTAQPEFRASNIPLSRVPLRVPSYPVYHNNDSVTSATGTPLHSTNLTPMYHPPPPSQQQHVTLLPTESTSHFQTNTLPSSLTYPAPARTSNRTIPRNMSTSSLAALAQNSTSGSNNNPYSTSTITNNGDAFPQQQQWTYQLYQYPLPTTIPSDNNQFAADYYTWKSVTEKKNGLQQQRLRSQSTPYYPKQQQRSHQ